MIPRACGPAMLALCLAAPAMACDRWTSHFDLCDAGTRWADGRWEQGGDSATLYLGEIGFNGFEDYFTRDPDKTIGAELDAALATWDESAVVTHHLRDKVKFDDITFVRSFDTMIFPDTKPMLRVTMIGVSNQQRIMVLGRAPEGTDIALLQQMSGEFAGLVQPNAATKGN